MKRFQRGKGMLWLILLAALVIIGVVIFLLAHKSNQTASTKSKSSSSQSIVSRNSPTQSTTNNSPATNLPESSPSAPPEAPSGSFVSSYNANTSTQETSTCNTTAGASCVITFTNYGTTVSLPAMTVTSSAKDPGHSFAQWTWTPQQYSLTAGSWSVSATATLNGQSTTTQSNQTLVVTQ